MKKHEYFESFSNIAYLISGLIVLLWAENHSPEHRLIFCLGMSALSSGSFIYHYYKIKPIYLFDWWAMMFCISCITGIVCDTQWVWYAVIGWQFVYSYFIMGRHSVYLEVALSAVPCLIAILVIKTWVTFGIILAIFLFAIWLRSKDPDPKQAIFHDSWQHSVWHIITAIGFSLVILLP